MDGHHGGIRTNERIEDLQRIVADLNIYFERVMRASEEYKKAGPGETADQDHIAAYVRKMLTDAGTDGGLENPLHRSFRTEAGRLELLNANGFIEDVVPVLQRIVRRRARLRVESADRELRIMVNREKMSQVIASIVAYGTEIIRKGGTITILAKLLPLKSGLPGKGGCALLSVTSNDVAAGAPGPASRHRTISKESARRAFAAIRSIIGEHHGSISVTRLPGKAQFNIYLPILRGV